MSKESAECLLAVISWVLGDLSTITLNETDAMSWLAGR